MQTKDKIQITLANLYAFSFGKKSILHSNLYSGKDSFYRGLLPGELFRVLFPDERQGQTPKNSPTHSKTANGLNTSAKYFREATRLLAEHLPAWKEHLTTQWNNILPPSRNLSAHIMDCFFEDDYLRGHPPLLARLTCLLKQGERQGYGEFFACLTLLACTRLCWTQVGFADLILPLDSSDYTAVSFLTEEEWAYTQGVQALSEGNPAQAIPLLQQALTLDDNTLRGKAHYQLSLACLALYEIEKTPSLPREAQEHLEQACQLSNPHAQMTAVRTLCSDPARHDTAAICRYCLCVAESIPPADEVLRGEAWYILYQHSHTGLFSPPDGDSALYYLRQSARLGYPDAVEEWGSRSQFSLVVQPRPTPRTAPGRCILNTCCRRAILFQSTIPENWEIIRDLSFAGSPVNYLNPGQPQKYLFLHDDAEKNLSDTLHLLQAIQDHDALSNTPDITIYLRGDRERLTPVIDTALHHMKDTVLPLHILDDAQWAAQYLLTLHPLFYPLHINPRPQTTLHFIILGSGKVCQWLVREGFWRMALLQSPDVTTKITVLTSDSESFLSELYDCCPGLDPQSPVMDRKRPLMEHFPSIQCEQVPHSFLDSLRPLLNHQQEQYYFAIDTGSDLDNLNLAIQLRELTIQTHIFSNSQTPPTQLPVIAFRCQEANIAHLSRSMVVQLADHGNAWYNNYQLIPFGCFDQRYTWQELEGGVLEQISLCIHMAYNGIDPRHTKEEEDSVRDSYYARQYNRDSSLSAAGTLPYLLFQSRYPDTPPIVPPHWDILDETSFLSRENRAHLIQQLHGMPKIEDSISRKSISSSGALYQWVEEGIYEKETRRLAGLEHIRWCGWMLSRGWLPASPRQAENYMKFNQNRQQLYIARLHPCICTNEELEALGKRLNKDFTRFDYRNIQLTEDFLAMRWLEQD